MVDSEYVGAGHDKYSINETVEVLKSFEDKIESLQAKLAVSEKAKQEAFDVMYKYEDKIERLCDALKILKEPPPDDESRIYLMGDYQKGFFCGLEDKNIADIYEAGLHGQEEGVEAVLEWCQGIACEALGDKE